MRWNSWISPFKPTSMSSAAIDPEILGLTDDSRQVQRGWVYVARNAPGADLSRFIQDALTRRAAGIVGEPQAIALAQKSAGDAEHELAWAMFDRVDQPLAGNLAEAFYDHPAGKLQIIGITGTKGKTTTAFLVQHLLRQARCMAGLIGTVQIDDGRIIQPAQLTTPGAIELSGHLARMVANDCQAVVAEFSSHALHQGRTATLNPQAAIFTNLSGEHLDYHRTMQEYARAKAILFDQLDEQALAVVNGDDPATETILRHCRARVVRCHVRPSSESLGCTHALTVAVIDRSDASGSQVTFIGDWGTIPLHLPLVGRHNVYNALQAFVAARHLVRHPTNAQWAQWLAECPSPPGRLEPVVIGKKTPRVLVDYAHTDDSLDKALQAVRPLTQGRLIVLFGCGGDRDRSKRPRMAAVACRLADRVIVTSDNPRTEPPLQIIDDILKGVADPATVQVEPDRAKAISLAIGMAKEKDVVLLAGKGHENYQIIGTEKRHFDDREEAAQVLEGWQSS